MSSDERFDVVDEWGHVVGQATRGECHANPTLIHQAVHVQVFDRDGRLFLQKRSAHKDVMPGKWDASVGGHLMAGEHPEHGARREMQEELGAEPPRLVYAYYYLWRAPNESELVRTFVTLHEGPFVLPPEEIEEGRFWSFDEIEARLGRGDFTHQFEHEFPRLRQYWLRKQASMTHFTRE
jgi:isopentenyldiphosphate isomerase